VPVANLISLINTPPRPDESQYDQLDNLKKQHESNLAAVEDELKGLNPGDPDREALEAEKHAMEVRIQVLTAQMTEVSGLGSDTNDPRAGPTVITLTNSRYSYLPRDAGGKWGRATVSPAQEFADGDVKIKLAAVRQWDAQWNEKHGPSIDNLAKPRNLAISVFHEVLEHSNGQKERLSNYTDYYGGKDQPRLRSYLDLSQTPALRDADVSGRVKGTAERQSPADIEMKAKSNATTDLASLSKNHNVPAITPDPQFRGFVALTTQSGGPRMIESELPSTPTTRFLFPDGIERVVAVSLDAQGLPFNITVK
jgi:hypothetical protein